MLDIRFIRQNPNRVKKGCQVKQVTVDIDKLLEIDKKRRQTLQALEDMRAQKNKANKEIQEARNKKEKDKIILKMQELDKNSDRLTKTLKELEEEFNNLMLFLPNLPQEDVPVGKDERENVVLREVGEKPPPHQIWCGGKAKDYLVLSEKLDLIDTKRAAKISGTRFGFIKKEAALLEFALINLAFDTLTQRGFIPIVPSVMLKSEMAMGMGYLEQASDEEAYYLPKDDLYLVGTSEQSIGTMHTEEIFAEKDLPKRYLGFSTCFRREAGAYGKDTKGIFRVHQFDKVEMFSFCRPDKSKEEHQLFLEMEEKLMKALKIPYRVIQLCTGDLARPSAATFDIESWLPGQNQYRETHSTSNCTDFQARRLNIRYRDKTGKLNFVHTINGTAFAIGRTLIAIIENYQQKDGGILLPEVLQKYTKFKKIPLK
ncbi:MAG: serine--tRNA ligase [Candidatus Nealsonbacteria bacterium CG_4_9_14_3_um_filter_37_13]|uniref:Serine--tRNA ligase n=2 Tax=Candidatus Nealsoniibacteriota TaxID=1817911 RepID=A0A2H0TJM1_9BACT|nr:MAG: serine--tRNA ligase [Candidatus Nealsonbacteria bacterium CG10_big_fil_rev_8_21_14_0_10_37_25]PJA84244.1 MAG: serine--tRNA ligase [Candidatus Nealsonbacteria bacterium CG_4_9_14_3_um_filter_37_13]